MSVPQRTEEGALFIRAVTAFLQVLLDEVSCDTVERNVTGLLAFAGNPQMPDAAALVGEIPDGEFAELLAAESMVEQGGEDGPISNSFQRFLCRGDEQFAGLVVGECRGLSLFGFAPGALHTLYRIVGDGVFVAQILE